MSSSLDEYLSFNTAITNTNKILEEMKSDYDLCIKQPAEYRKKVDAISDLFHLTLAKGNRLKSSDCPVYIVGHSNEYVMVGLNPGYSAVNNPVEDIEARKS